MIILKTIKRRITIANVILLTKFRTIKIVTTTINIIIKKTTVTTKNSQKT